MKKVFLLVTFLLILSGACFALTLEDNGYAWNAASYEDKSAFCKELSKTNGKDYLYWVDIINAFYSIDNWGIMSTKIKNVAEQISMPEQPAEPPDK